ncbi:MAG: nitroreductase family protein [Betaproteobacteria bacterium]|nr:nitroreductase family protein [Betaproteobacteria bacterium]NBT10878.1 nitroreductase family protein [Betaproteobacteria bacterium]
MTRTAQAPVDRRFIDRWSPRSFTGKPISAADIMSLFEAARWAPSTSNTQPWRFVYGLAGSAGFEAIFSTLVPFNQGWAQRASALVAVLSATQSVAPGTAQAKPSPNHAFDTGAAWMSLALQAETMGWRTHAMGGFNADALRLQLEVPAGFAVHCVVAVGEQGPRENLPAELQEREVPNARQPLEAMVAEGRFRFQA